MEKLIRGVTLLGIALISFTLILVFVIQPDSESQYKKSNKSRTLLLQIRGEDKFSEINFIVTQRGAKWFYLPSDLVLAVEPTLMTIGSTSQNLILTKSRDEFNESYGLAVDDAWQIDLVAFASLVESANGVEVKNPFSQTLNGFEAINYVFEATENPKVILDRFIEVWPAVISSFDSKDLINVLTAIGSSSRSSVEQYEFASYLRAMARLKDDVVFKESRVDDESRLTFKSRKRLIQAGVRETLAP